VFQKYDPQVVRYFFLSTHYRAPINFTFEALSGVKNALERVQQAYFALADSRNFGTQQIDCAKYRLMLEEALDDDLNVSVGLAVWFEFVNEIYKHKDTLSKAGVEEALDLFEEIDSIFGILVHEREEAPKKVVQLAEERELARKDKDWKTADELREKIKQLGYTVADDKEGYKLSKV
jgi:cysteinyl-tRNA synthetase